MKNCGRESMLCSSSPTVQQNQHFLRSLVLPVFMCNSVIWFNSCTQDKRDVFVTFCSKLGFSSDITLLVKNAILHHAGHIIAEKTQILNSCYVMGRRSNLSVPCKTNRSRDSCIPFSIINFSTQAYVYCA